MSSAHAHVAVAPHAGTPNYQILIEGLIDPLAKVAGDDVASGLRRSILAVIDMIITAKDAAIAQTITAKDETIAAKDEAIAQSAIIIAAKEQVVAAKEELITSARVETERTISDKTAQLATYKAQFEPRILLDTLWAALVSSGLLTEEEKKPKSKWSTLIRDVMRDGELTAAAMTDLRDLGALPEKLTVISDLGSLSNRLSSAHHSGATDMGGTGWRVGTSPSPHLAAALVLSANMRTLRNFDSLSGDIIFLDRQCNESHRFDVGSLRWTSTTTRDASQ